MEALWNMETRSEIAPRDLPISNDLQSRLRHWSRLLETDSESGDDFNVRFHVEGFRLAADLQESLGSSARVHYFRNQEGPIQGGPSEPYLEEDEPRYWSKN